MPHKYIAEQIDFIMSNFNGIGNIELTEKFNNHFGLDLTVGQIKGFKKNKKLDSGLDGHFKKGSVPKNKGTKGLQKANSTSFKKGNKPHNYLPIGTERINSMGYVDIKIEENKWKYKQIIVWENVNGKVPEGHAVIFGDRNNRNFDIDNLILVSKTELAIMNGRKLIRFNSEFTTSGLLVAKIYLRINQITKKKV